MRTDLTHKAPIAKMWVVVAVVLACAAAMASAQGAEVVVVQKGKTFLPAAITVKPGDTVVFRNEDGVNHNAFSDVKGMQFNVRSQAPGTSTPITLDNEGTAEIRCAFHPAMKLQVTVAK